MTWRRSMEHPAQPARPARRADAPLPARLSLLLQSARARSARRTSSTPRPGRACSARRRRSACCRCICPAASRARGAISSRSPRRRTTAGLYTNLITSGVGITDEHAARPARRRPASTTCRSRSRTASERPPTISPAIDGAFARKRALAAEVVRLGLPLTVNVVMHRANIERIGDMVELALALGASRVEIAHVQYYGWALKNRAALMPTREQVERAARDGRGAARRAITAASSSTPWCRTITRAIPKPCVGGWGRRSLNVTPSGKVLPCHAAESIPGLEFWNVREHSLADIWANSPAFNAFRGTDWMQEPCASCARREIDFGGCRCQAFALTGDAARDRPGLPSVARARAGGGARRGAGRRRLRLPAHVTTAPGFRARQNPGCARAGACRTLPPRKPSRPAAGASAAPSPTTVFQNREDMNDQIICHVPARRCSPARFGLLIAAGPAVAQAPPGFSPIDKTKPAEEQAGHQPQAASDAADRRRRLDKLPVDKIKLPAGFKAEVWSHGHPGGRTMVMGDKGTMFMGTRADRPRLCDHRQGRQARGQDPAAGPDPAERARLQGRRALRVRHQQGVPLRQHRGQARQSGRAGRADRQAYNLPGHHPSQLEIRRRSDRTARCTCRSARTATSARSIPASTARSAATTPTAPAWRSSRAACATRSASTGTR